MQAPQRKETQQSSRPAFRPLSGNDRHFPSFPRLTCFCQGRAGCAPQQSSWTGWRPWGDFAPWILNEGLSMKGKVVGLPLCGVTSLTALSAVIWSEAACSDQDCVEACPGFWHQSAKSSGCGVTRTWVWILVLPWWMVQNDGLFWGLDFLKIQNQVNNIYVVTMCWGPNP